MKIFISEKQILKEEIDFSSFYPKDELCPYIFHDNSQIKKDIRKSLLEIANDFYDFMEFDWLEDGIKDIWLVGSLASFNWSELYSDIDLHIILDFSEISSDKRIVENTAWAMKTLYNEKHDIEIEKFNVEVYAQDINEDIKSDGIYSILRQTWIRKPVKKEFNIKRSAIERFTNPIEAEVENALSLYRQGEYDKSQRLADSLEDKIINLRKIGLSQGGEFDPRNLAFKALRRNGSLEKVNQMKINSFDNEISIEDEDVEEPKEKEQRPEIKSAPTKQQVKGSPKDSSVQSVKKQQEKSDDEYTDGISYSINGRRFSSLRDAEKQLGTPKSTLEYRVNSDAPKWKSYKKTT